MNAIKAFRTVPVVVIVQLLSRVLLFVTPWTAAHQTVVRMVLGTVRTVPRTWQRRINACSHYHHRRAIISLVTSIMSSSSPVTTTSSHHRHHHHIGTLIITVSSTPSLPSSSPSPSLSSPSSLPSAASTYLVQSLERAHRVDPC